MHDCCSSDGCSTAPVEHGVCRHCGRAGHPVERGTVDALLKGEARDRLQPVVYDFDSNPTCPVVYFSNASDSYFGKEDLNVRVGIKEDSDPIPVCYCFGHTRHSIETEIVDTGESTVFDSVRAKVRAGECECEIRNPSGNCCLGEITRTVRTVKEDLKIQSVT